MTRPGRWVIGPFIPDQHGGLAVIAYGLYRHHRTIAALTRIGRLRCDRKPAFRRYAGAMIAVCIALVVRALLQPLLGTGAPFNSVGVNVHCLTASTAA